MNTFTNTLKLKPMIASMESQWNNYAETSNAKTPRQLQTEVDYLLNLEAVIAEKVLEAYYLDTKEYNSREQVGKVNKTNPFKGLKYNSIIKELLFA